MAHVANGTSAAANGHRTAAPTADTPSFEQIAHLAQVRPLTDRERTLPEWADKLVDWWCTTATDDITGSIAKVVEYGGSGAAYDLQATGRDLAAMNGRTVDDQEATELGILFYLSSKVNRWMAAVIDGRRPSDDTLLDITYYAMMARRNRAVGGWPVA